MEAGGGGGGRGGGRSGVGGAAGGIGTTFLMGVPWDVGSVGGNVRVYRTFSILCLGQLTIGDRVIDDSLLGIITGIKHAMCYWIRN